MLRRTLLLGAVLALHSAAAFAQPAPVAPATTDVEPDARLPEVDDPMLAEVPPPRRVLTSWQQALGIARARASSLEISRAQIEQAQGVHRQTLAGALPTLTGTGNINYHLLTGEGPDFSTLPITVRTLPDPRTTWNAGLTLRVPVFAPQAWYDTGTASDSVRVAKLDAQETQRLVLAQVADAIVTVVTAERVAEVSRVSLGAGLSTLELNRARARLGASSAVDVLRAEQEVSLARAQVVQANENVRRAREALGLALGTSESWGVTPAIRLDALAQDARSSCQPQRSVEGRPDIRAAQADVAIAERGVKSVDWSYLPTVDLVSTMTYWSDDRFTANRDSVTWTIGGVLTWTLYDGGLRYGIRETNEARVRIARQTLTQAKRQATVEVTQTYRGVEVAEANLAVSVRSREIAFQSSRLARIAFLNGSGTSFDLVETSRRLREAELDLAIKEFEVVRAKIAALLALASCRV